MQDTQQALYDHGVLELPYYQLPYPSLVGTTNSAIEDELVTYRQYSEDTVPGFHYEGL